MLSLVQSFQLSYAIKNQLKASKILCLSHKERWLQCTERINYIGAANRFLPCMEATYLYGVSNSSDLLSEFEWSSLVTD